MILSWHRKTNTRERDDEKENHYEKIYNYKVDGYCIGDGIYA